MVVMVELEKLKYLRCLTDAIIWHGVKNIIVVLMKTKRIGSQCQFLQPDHSSVSTKQTAEGKSLKLQMPGSAKSFHRLSERFFLSCVYGLGVGPGRSLPTQTIYYPGLLIVRM